MDCFKGAHTGADEIISFVLKIKIKNEFGIHLDLL
jgi:hypothetical protein